MNKKEVLEIRKQFSPKNCAITKICGCYVDYEKNKKMESKDAFLALPEEEAFKYFDIFKKTLSGSIGKNMLNMEFPLDAEMPGGTQEFLLKLRDSRLEDDMLLEEFYDKVIATYEYAENYYIILIHAAYDVPGRTSDDLEMDDASDEVYQHILMSICPVSLSKAGLSYNAEENCIQDRIRDWIVDKPDKGFLFPAFNDRSTDLHSVLYYTKKSEDLQPEMIDQLLGAKMPMSADTQKETFQMIIEDTLGEDGDYETVRNIHETLNDMIEEHKEEPDPLTLDKTDVKKIFEQSGVSNEKMENFEKELPVIIKSMKNKLWSSLDDVISKYMNEFGPYGAIDVIGAPSAGVTDSTKGMMAEVRKLEKMMKDYTPSGEYTRIIDSIKTIVAKRFFTFPSAKRETENGYFDACIKEALAAERTKLIDELDAQDLFGDTLRWLQQRAERLDEIYSQFGEDLKNSIEDLANNGDKAVGNILKKAKRHEFLPTDYVTSRRIKEMETGIIKLMLDNESNIDSGRVVPVKDEMEKIYRELFSGVGAYGPEKMFTVAFADKKLTEQDLNVMYGSPINDRRTSIMEEAARAFVDDISEEQPLCVLADGYKEKLLAKKYISVPNVMPYFSKAVKAILMAPPYNEKEDSITLNPGEIEISIDDIFVGVPVSMMQCAMEMQMAYNAVYDYKGLHIDEVNKDMKSFPDFVTI